MPRTRRSFSPEFKAQVVLDVLSGAKSQAEVCREHQLSPHLFAQWRTTFLERAASIFSPEEQRSQEQARIGELERLVGKQALELEALKKGSSILGSLRRRSEP